MSLAKRIIPCLDINAGRVVKGIRFKQIKDAGDPVEVAKRYDQEGADELAFLDITASLDQRETLVRTVEAVAEQIFIPLTVGGGVRTIDDIRRLLNAGADKITINTAAVSHPEFVAEAASHFGSQCVVVAIDAKQSTPNTWQVYTHGGHCLTDLNALTWAQKMEHAGAGEILLTSMDRDGTKSGFDLHLTQTVSEAVNIPVIASGGVGSLQHMADGVKQGKANAVLVASIFHFCEYTIAEAKQFMAMQGIEVRI